MGISLTTSPNFRTPTTFSETSTSQSIWRAELLLSEPTVLVKVLCSNCWSEPWAWLQAISTEMVGYPCLCSLSTTSINWNSTCRLWNSLCRTSQAAPSKLTAAIWALSVLQAHCLWGQTIFCQVVKNQEWLSQYRCGKTLTFWYWTSQPTI